ncbi:putative MFS family arabinose efflux permease [Murinocardiopsis flavida]|uniref:Putative MFS family arabinose efflux permease n=1 Tax=Murinocardiopsis flavida TaxID=645275 RepID=A0A2P8DP16_9ACTN|nr:MFS transporter [Murinocardiopsis flavida]PSK98962.1 putative MFS family arabinose efflux permease [Murinocardiopsis flavida]
MGWFVRILIHGVLFHGAFSTLRPVISYRALELGMGPVWLGVFTTALALVPLIVAIPIGRWVDLHDERPAYLAGSAFLTASAFGLAYARGPATIIACSIAAGIGIILAMVAAQAIVANRSPRHTFDTRFGYFSLAGSAGQLLGPLLLAGLAATEPASLTTLAFTGCGIAAAGSLLALLGMPRTPHAPRSATTRPAPPQRSIDVLRTPGITPAILASLAVLASIDMITVYLPALGEERGLSATAVSLLLALRAASSVISRLFLGAAVARKGRHTVLIASIALSAAAVTLLTVPLPLWALALAMTAAGLGLGIGQPLTMAWVADAAAPTSRASAMALRMTGNHLGQATLPLLAGTLAAGLGVAAVFATFGGLLTATTLTLRRSRPGRRPPGR